MSICTCCRGEVSTLAFVSPLHGNLCQECYDKYRNCLTTRQTNPQTALWYKCADELGITEDVNRTLKEFHKRYQALPCFEFKYDSRFMIMRFSIIYKGNQTMGEVKYQSNLTTSDRRVYFLVVTKSPTYTYTGSVIKVGTAEEWVLKGNKFVRCYKGNYPEGYECH